MKPTVAIACFAFMIMAVGATSASAQTKKSFPGSACVEVDSDAHPEIYYKLADGSARSPDTGSAVDFRCTIMRETPDTSSIANVFARVENKSGSSLSCYVRSCTKDGATCSVSTPPWPAEGVCGPYNNCTLDLASATGYTDGYAYVQCEIPAVEAGQMSGIVYYRWED